MKISKTQFKNFTRCSNHLALTSLYNKRVFSDVYMPDDDINALLEQMFDSDGEDLINVFNEQLELLLPVYKQIESDAIDQAKKDFKKDIISSSDTFNQKLFNYNDGIDLYCYLDGYAEDETSVDVFEVKATTSKKFYDLGYTEKKVFNSLFHFQNKKLCLIDFDTIFNNSKFHSKYDIIFDRYSSVGRYIFDLAVQRFIIEHSKQYNPNKEYHYYLIVLNHNYVYDGKVVNGKRVYQTDINGNDLYLYIDCDLLTKNYQSQIEALYYTFKNEYLHKKLDQIKIGKYCEATTKTRCEFYDVCYKDLQSPNSILNYFSSTRGFIDENKNYHSVYDLVNCGKTKMEDIPTSWLNDNRKIQHLCLKNKEYINLSKIKSGLDQLTYPLYYLDFESLNYPLPRFFNERAYSQSLFQYSLHVEREPFTCDKEKDHYEFLAQSNEEDCREELIQQLIKDIRLENGGTVIVYNQSFEKTRIKELASAFPKYKQELLNINDHIFDLLYLVKNNKSFYEKLQVADIELNNYYHYNLCGSYSIKKVLPLASNLSYKDLEVQNGNEAMIAYLKFSILEKEQLQKVQESLKKYCCQDTWAMVVILRWLEEKVK